MNKKMNLKKVGRLLSLVLRHQPSKIGINLDRGGWVNVDILIKAIQSSGQEINLEGIKEIVRTNNKQRFSFSDNGKKIRANQGHSVDVDLGLVAVKPPTVLYHGTATKNLDSIFKTGIEKCSRQHVHLSDDLKTATAVGSRHGKVIILGIKAEEMSNKGFDFFISKNGVWLTDNVPREFIEDL